MLDLWTLLSTLLGVIVGGIITFLTTRTIENQKWEKQKKDKYLQDRREALGMLMDWIDPIDRAINRARSLSSPFSEKPEEWQQYWPNLQGEIAKMDLRPRHRVLLPEEVYAGARPIINMLDEIYTLSTQMEQERTLMNSSQQYDYWNEKWTNHVKELVDKLKRVRILADEYQKRLEKEFNATYD